MKIATILLTASLLAACASGPPPLLPPEMNVRPVVQKDNLDGRWTIAALNGQPMTGLMLEFAGTTLSARLACNGGSGTISRNGDKLMLDRLMMTERACTPDIQRIDDLAGAVLRLPMTMELTPPNRLRLVNESGSIDLIRQGS
jgi:heat shock protein HslJ